MRRSLAAVSVVLVLTGCGSAAPGSAPTPSAASAIPGVTLVSSSPSPPAPAGCDQAMLAVAQVRSDINSASTERQMLHSEERFAAVIKSLPSGQLKLDADRAALILSLYNLTPSGKKAREFARALAKVSHDCGT